jgi:MFS family permease
MMMLSSCRSNKMIGVRFVSVSVLWIIILIGMELYHCDHHHSVLMVHSFERSTLQVVPLSKSRARHTRMVAPNHQQQHPHISPPNDDHPTTTSTMDISRTLRYIQWCTFLMMMSGSMVALVPVQATLQLFSNDQGRTTRYLSLLTTIAALTELTCSQSVGALLDRLGRRVVLSTIVSVVAVLHTLTALFQPMSLVTIALQKCIVPIAFGFFIITTQTIITDCVILSSTASTITTTSSIQPLPHNHNNQNNNSGIMLSSVMGQQMAVTGLGFLCGIVTAGMVSAHLNHYHVWIYRMAAAWTTLTYLLIRFRLVETHGRPSSVTRTKNVTRWESIQALVPTAFQSLLSGTNLLTKYGIKIRILSILLLIMTLPMFMGDLFQIYAKTEWNLSTSMFSTYLSLFAITGIVSNVVGSVLIKSMGIRTFTQLAILSKMIPSLFTILFGYRGSMIGIIVGFLGNAQSIGIVAALISQSTMTTTATDTSTGLMTTRSKAKNLPSSTIVTDTMKLPSSQGVMAGERASLMALLKVIGPLLYSTLYIYGQRYFNTSNLPFIFNIMLSIIALLIVTYYL